MNNLKPILLRPSGKDYLWGGENLKNRYGKNKYADLNNTYPLAETWECSVHPDGPSYAVVGDFKGRSLKEIIDLHPEYLGTKCRGAFPILIKFIDAQQELSVQVHPDDKYARKYENGQNGKTEMWYVLEATKGSRLVLGFEHGMTKEGLRSSIDNGSLSKDLHFVPVHQGDVFLIEAGTVHAIGAGTILVEVQENSNITYRLYDYGRLDKDGKKREIHFDKAVQVLNMNRLNYTWKRPRLIHYYYGYSREILIRCRYFEVEKIQVLKGFSFSVQESSFQVLLCVNGEGGVESNDSNRPLRFEKGSCVFLPAGLGRLHIIGNCDLLKVRC